MTNAELKALELRLRRAGMTQDTARLIEELKKRINVPA